jgi:hypothetical protein
MNDTFVSSVDQLVGQLGPVNKLVNAVASRVLPTRKAKACTSIQGYTSCTNSRCASGCGYVIFLDECGNCGVCRVQVGC